MKNPPKNHTRPAATVDLQKTIESIGIARFVGRINSGVIPGPEGYAVVEQFVARAQARPFLSRLSSAVLGRRDSYRHR